MHKDLKKVMFDEGQIAGLADSIAERINADYEGESLTAVVVLKGSLVFAADLIPVSYTHLDVYKRQL